jgi:hypothetical protein
MFMMIHKLKFNSRITRSLTLDEKADDGKTYYVLRHPRATREATSLTKPRPPTNQNPPCEWSLVVVWLVYRP